MISTYVCLTISTIIHYNIIGLCLLDKQLHALFPLVTLEGDDVHEVVVGHLHLRVPKQKICLKDLRTQISYQHSVNSEILRVTLVISDLI